MRPRGTYGPETTYVDRRVRQTEWVARGSEPYLIDWPGLERIFGQGAEWPEVGATFNWLGVTWRVVAEDPRGWGLLVRRDGRRARWEIRAASWWARLPGWLRRWLVPIARRLGMG
ncbi:MAG: hypothetical protein M3O34_10275 [Chloroflexota bacterium]|nr:hypothetical protein [Chloroflexota bacterium]